MKKIRLYIFGFVVALVMVFVVTYFAGSDSERSERDQEIIDMTRGIEFTSGAYEGMVVGETLESYYGDESWSVNLDEENELVEVTLSGDMSFAGDRISGKTLFVFEEEGLKELRYFIGEDDEELLGVMQIAFLDDVYEYWQENIAE